MSPLPAYAGLVKSYLDYRVWHPFFSSLVSRGRVRIDPSVGLLLMNSSEQLRFQFSHAKYLHRIFVSTRQLLISKLIKSNKKCTPQQLKCRPNTDRVAEKLDPSSATTIIIILQYICVSHIIR